MSLKYAGPSCAGRGLPNHLDSIPPLLFSLRVCSPAPVLVGLLVGLLVVITVLVIYTQSWGQKEIILGPSETQLIHLSLAGKKNAVPR